MNEYFQIVGQDRYVELGTQLLHEALDLFPHEKKSEREMYLAKLHDPERNEALALLGFAISPEFSSAFDFNSLEERHIFLHRVAGRCQFIDFIGYLTFSEHAAHQIKIGIENIREVIRILGLHHIHAKHS